MEVPSTVSLQQFRHMIGNGMSLSVIKSILGAMSIAAPQAFGYKVTGTSRVCLNPADAGRSRLSIRSCTPDGASLIIANPADAGLSRLSRPGMALAM